MDKFVVRRSSSPDEPPQPLLRRPPWKRSVVELVGRFPSKYRHEISGLLLDSYSEIGAFPHLYHIGQSSCLTHANRIINISDADLPRRREGISGLDFDTKGIYVASVTKSGCLTVHDFETLFCLSGGTPARSIFGRLHSENFEGHWSMLLIVQCGKRNTYSGFIRWRDETGLEKHILYMQVTEIIWEASLRSSKGRRLYHTHTLLHEQEMLNTVELPHEWDKTKKLDFSENFVVLHVHDGLKEDENKHLLHLSTHQQLDVVRWNLANQDEVACTSRQSNEVSIYDIGYVSAEPVEVLRKKPTVTVYGCEVPRGLSDIAFTSIDKSRLLASDMHGVINMWDRRMSNLPCLHLSTNSHSTINSIQINVENQIVFGAGKHGIIYAWDIRGGRSSHAFQSHKEVCYPPLTSVKLAPIFEGIGLLKAQSDIFSREIHSIDLDPSCPYQLAFHLDDGWSGVLDTNSYHVTHIHCPPPAWLNGPDMSNNCLYLRKPTWLPTSSIYAVGSSSDNGIHLLDFFPGPNSACHVDANEDIQNIAEEKNQNLRNKFIPLSERVSVCAAHPLNGTIIAGTKQSSLLVISQRHQSYRSEDSNTSDEKDS